MAEKVTPTMIEDLIALQKAMPPMPKDTTNPFFKSKYTPLDTIVELAMPIVHKHNFAWSSQPSTNSFGKPSLKYQLLHISGEKIEGEMELMLSKLDSQGQGSAITYARRYSLGSVLNIVSDEDDDGNAAKQAAQAAKDAPATNEYEPPEPSRDINDTPITNVGKEKLRRAIEASNRFKTAVQVKEFYQFILDKDAPSTEQDVDQLIEALK